LISKPKKPAEWQRLPYQPYNPLDKSNLAESIADALLSHDPQLLPPREHFLGAGVYVIYYVGDHPVYKRIAEDNRGGKWRAPIYVGKADAPGSRKGGFTLEFQPHCSLFDRLWQHAISIDSAENLQLEHFHCQYVVLDEVWVPLAESLLIQRFSPVWNVLIEGFGIHDPGAGRRVQKRSQWDTLHPGRSFAGKQADAGMDDNKLRERIQHFLDERDSK
jgi:Eco29kI restriction endonuclease